MYNQTRPGSNQQLFHNSGSHSNPITPTGGPLISPLQRWGCAGSAMDACSQHSKSTTMSYGSVHQLPAAPLVNIPVVPSIDLANKLKGLLPFHAH